MILFKHINFENIILKYNKIILLNVEKNLTYIAQFKDHCLNLKNIAEN